jgi:hypothetical protein
MKAYIHRYANNYTYICNRDSLIIGKFWNSLHFVNRMADQDAYYKVSALP